MALIMHPIGWIHRNEGFAATLAYITRTIRGIDMANELQGKRIAILATDGVEQVELTVY
jgi:hypothetical protein